MRHKNEHFMDIENSSVWQTTDMWMYRVGEDQFDTNKPLQN